MLKEIFEQFVGSGAICLFYSDGVYLYKYNENKMLVNTNTTFPYTPQAVQELIHQGFVGVDKITIS